MLYEHIKQIYNHFENISDYLSLIFGSFLLIRAFSTHETRETRKIHVNMWPRFENEANMYALYRYCQYVSHNLKTGQLKMVYPEGPVTG
jgi:hypothetical protein